MDYTEPFEESLEIVRSCLTDVDAPQILIGVTENTELRDHFLAELRKKLDGNVDLLDFRYDPQHLSLLEGASASAHRNSDDAVGHRVAVSAVGLEALPNEEQQNAIKLLNAERNRIGYARLVVLLWLNRKLFVDVANKSYDFYSCSSQTFFLEPPADWSAEKRLDSLRRSYLQAIVHQNQYVNMQGLAPMRGGQLVQMRMDEIFIPLHVEREVRSTEPFLTGREDELESIGSVSGSGEMEMLVVKDLIKMSRLQWRTETLSRRAEIPELLRVRRAVVLGDPGAGKTTMLRYVAYQIAQSQLGQAGTPALPGEVADCLPVYVRIGLYAQHLKERPEATIVDFAPQQNYQLPLTAELLRDAVNRGKALFLLDGLDEIVDTAQRREVAQRVEEFARQHDNCPVIVTSRIVGYREAALGSAFTQFTIRPFDDEEIKSFVRQWYKTLDQPERADDLISAIEKNPSVRRLATNPLLLTVAALIHLRNTKLPNRRVELYQRAAETLVDNWMSERRVTPDEWDADEALNDLLPAVAWWLHTEASGGLIGQDDLRQLLVETMRVRNPRLTEAEAHTRASQFRRNVSEFSGIFLERGLDEQGNGLYGFLHLTFEEYFAAIRLKDKWKREGHAALKPLLHHPRWTEVILLCAGSMDQFDASRLVEAILDARSEYESLLHRDLLLVTRVLADDVRVDPPLRRDIVRRLSELYFSEQSPEALKDDIRQAFAGLAGTYAGGDVVGALENRLGDGEGVVRSASANALGAMGKRAASKGMIEKLLSLLDDNESYVQEAAARALGAMGERAASQGVIEKLLSLLENSKWHEWSAAACALEGVGERAANEQVVERLLRFLSVDEESVPGEGARAIGRLLGRVGDKRRIEGLFELLTSSKWILRFVAEVAIGSLEANAASERVIEKLLELLSDSEGHLRLAAARTLRAMGERAASEAVIEKLLLLLEDGEETIRSAAADALGAMGERAASEAVIEKLVALLADNEWSVRSAAASALGAMGEQAAMGEVVEKLIALLYDASGESPVGWVAACALGEMGKEAGREGVIKKLVALLDDSKWYVRYAAALALGKMGERAAREDVIEKLIVLLADSEGHAQFAAARALGQLGVRAAREDVIENLISLLTARDFAATFEAKDALGKLSPKVGHNARLGVIKLLLSLMRKRGEGHRIANQRNAGYIALRNLMAAEVG